MLRKCRTDLETDKVYGDVLLFRAYNLLSIASQAVPSSWSLVEIVFKFLIPSNEIFVGVTR